MPERSDAQVSKSVRHAGNESSIVGWADAVALQPTRPTVPGAARLKLLGPIWIVQRAAPSASLMWT